MTAPNLPALDALIAAVEAGNEHKAAIEAGNIASEHRDNGAYWPAHDAMKAYRGSFDAFLTLREALLPGWKWGAHEPKPGIFRVYVCPWSALRPMPWTEESAIASRAGLLATLKAYRAQVAG